MPRLSKLTAPLLLIASLAAFGCEEEVQRPATPPAAPPVAPPPPAPPAVDEQPLVEYQRPEYPDNMRRNPFQPDPDIIKPSGPVQTEESRPLEPLEQFALNQLKLTAIISEVAVPKAMFIDPNGFGHVVKEGDRIGRAGGYISDIRDNEVDVQESGGEDDTTSRVRTLRLRDLEIRSDDQDELTEAERQALEKMLESEVGRRALREKLRGDAPASSSFDGDRPPDPFVGTAPPR